MSACSPCSPDRPVATRAAKDERDRFVARVRGLDEDTGGALDHSIGTTPEVEVLPDVLIKEAADALHQAETAYRAAAARIQQLDRMVGQR